MENMLRKGNSQVSESIKRTSKGEMGRSPNLLKESLASSAMDMDMSRKNVLII